MSVTARDRARTAAAGATNLVPTAVGLLLLAYLWQRNAPAAHAARLSLELVAAAAMFLWALLAVETFVPFAVLPALIYTRVSAQAYGAKVSLGDVLLVMALAGWAARSVVRADTGASRVARNPLLGALVLVAGTNAASLAWSSSVHSTAQQTVQVIELALFVTVLFAGVPTSLRRIRMGLLLYVAVAVGLAIPEIVIFLRSAAHGKIAGAAFGPYNKNELGAFIASALAIAYTLWLDRVERATRVTLGAAWVVLALGLGASASRGSIAGAVAGLMAVGLLLRRSRLFTAAVVGGGLAAFGLSIEAAINEHTRIQVAHGGYSTVAIRFQAWSAAWHSFLSHPLGGTGAGTFIVYFPHYQSALSDPNNLLLLTAAELGLVGLSAICYLLYRFGRVLLAARFAAPEARRIAVASGAAALTGFVHFQFDISWVRGETSTCFAFVGLMIAALNLGEDTEKVEAAERAGRSLRVMHLVTTTGYAGLERHALGLVASLRARGVDAVIACRPAARELRAEAARRDVPVVPERLTRASWSMDVNEAALQFRPHVVHVHDGAAALLGWQVSRVCRAQLIRTQHFIETASALRRGWRRNASLGAHRAINSDVTALVAVSDSVAEAVRSRREIPASRVVVVPTGVAVPDDGEVEQAVAARERALPTVAFVGRLEREKQPETLLHAVPLVLRRIPEARFVFVGDGPERERLEQRCRELGVDERVEWTGAVPDATLIIRRAHVLVDPLPTEAFGLVLAEAMAWAVPVVATTTGGGGELVTKSGGGLTFDPGDSTTLAQRIVQLLRDHELASSLGRFGREFAVRSLDLEKTAAAVDELYQQVTAKT